MKRAGQIVLFWFPRTGLEEGKLRPALLLGRLPGDYDDWLLCMVSSQVRHRVAGFDEVIQEGDADFAEWLEGAECDSCWPTGCGRGGDNRWGDWSGED